MANDENIEETGITEYPSNSYKSREKEAEKSPPPVKKVAHGTAVVRRKGVIDRIKDWLFVDEDEYEDFVYEDLIRPAILDAIWDISNNVVDTVKDALGISLFGGGRSSRRRRGGYYRTSYDDYDEYWNRERRGRRRRSDRYDDEDRRGSRRRRSDEVAAKVESRSEAVELVHAMQERVHDYKVASVLNFYDMADMPTLDTDDNYGWDLGHPFEATISRTRDGYIVEPCAPVWLDR